MPLLLLAFPAYVHAGAFQLWLGHAVRAGFTQRSRNMRLQAETIARSSVNSPRFLWAFPILDRARSSSQRVRTAQGPKLRQQSRTEKAMAAAVSCLHAKVGPTAPIVRVNASTNTAAAWQFCSWVHEQGQAKCK